MKLTESDIPTIAIKGYIVLPAKRFEEISPFLLRNQQRMMEIVGDAPILDKLPDWAEKLSAGPGGLNVWEWSGHIIIEEQNGGN